MAYLGLSARHLALVARQSIRQTVRGGAGIIFIVVLLLTGLTFGGLIVDLLEKFTSGSLGVLKPGNPQQRGVQATSPTATVQPPPAVVAATPESDPTQPTKNTGQPANKIAPPSAEPTDRPGPDQGPANPAAEEPAADLPALAEEGDDAGDEDDLTASGEDPFSLIFRDIGRRGLASATGADEAALEEWLDHRPSMVTVIILGLLWSVAPLVSLGAFNQTAADIQYKGLRYLLPRTSRANILLGRFAGTMLFVGAVLVVLNVTLVLYLALRVPQQPLAPAAAWLAWGTLAMLLLAMPYVAMGAWISAWIGHPFGALTVGQVVLAVSPILVAIADSGQSAAIYPAYLTPWPLKYDLIHPHTQTFATAAVAMVAYTMAYLGLGLWMFSNKDL